MQNINRRERTLIIFMVVVVIAAAGLYFTGGKSSSSSVKLLSKDQAERQYKKDRDTYARLVSDQDATGPRIQKLVYDQDANTLIPRVVRDLQVIANQSGVHLSVVRPLKPHALPSGLGMRVPMEVHFRASFQPYVVRFLYHVEDPAGRMVLDKMDVTGAEAQFKTVDVSATISVFTRSLNTDANSGQGDASDGTQG